MAGRGAGPPPPPPPPWPPALNSFFRYFYTMNGFDCVRSHMRLLAFGTIDPNIMSKSYVTHVGTAPEAGGASTFSNGASAEAYDAMFGDTCAFLARSIVVDKVFRSTFNVTKCRSFDGGVLQQGLTATIEKWWAKGYVAADRALRVKFNSTADSLVNGTGYVIPAHSFNYTEVSCLPEKYCTPGHVVHPSTSPLKPTHISDASYAGDLSEWDVAALPSDAAPTTISEQLNSAENEFLLESDEEYVTPALIALFQMYADEASTTTTAYLWFLNVFTPCFMTAFVLLMAFWFLPQTVAENRAMQTKRGMLLYVPVFVLHKIRALRDIIANVIAEDAAATMGTTAAAALGSSARIAPV